MQAAETNKVTTRNTIASYLDLYLAWQVAVAVSVAVVGGRNVALTAGRDGLAQVGIFTELLLPGAVMWQVALRPLYRCDNSRIRFDLVYNSK